MDIFSKNDLTIFIKDEIKKINENTNGEIDSLDSLGWALLISELDSKGYKIDISEIIGIKSIDDLISNLEKK